MKFVSLVLWAYAVFVLQTALGPRLALGTAAPDFVALGLVVAASFPGPVQAVLCGFVWGLIADGLAGGQFGAETVCCVWIALTVHELHRRRRLGSIWSAGVVLLAAAFIDTLSATAFQLWRSGQPLVAAPLALHAASVAVLTLPGAALWRLALRLTGEHLSIEVPPAPVVTNRWRMLTE